MKQMISKSAVMKRAWKIFKGNNPYSYSFSASLRRAWFVEKEAARAEVERQATSVIRVRNNYNPILDASSYYQDNSQGRYFGD